MTNVNIKNIAEQAGVSLATVSRVINNSAKVSEEKAKRVRKVASGLGYRLNPKPPAKACFKTRNVALVYAGWSMMEIHEWGFVDGLESVFSENDLRLMLVRMPDDGSLPSVFTQRDCDGILVLADLRDVPQENIDKLESFPCIQMLHGDVRQAFGDEVFCDNLSVARLAYEHLHSLNVKQYGYMNLFPSHRACSERQMFFEMYLKQAGLSCQSWLADPQEEHTVPSHELALQLVKQMVVSKKLPDGLFVPTDFQLPEIYTALRDHGISPMQDMTIISCDNCDRHLVKTQPRPASIDLRLHDLGCYAARQLIWRIEHPQSAPVRLFIKPQVVCPE
ncbi:MAG: LacI family DNA-binding transcriptional regulator [Phycisphaeraceae bacterium JB051]